MEWRGLALLPEPAWPVQCNGRVTPDWVMFSAERGGADLALLHRALTTPNEDVIQQAEWTARKLQVGIEITSSRVGTDPVSATFIMVSSSQCY